MKTMEENKNSRVEENDVENADIDMVAAYEELRNNSVSKAEHEKVVAENRRLVQSLINGGSMKQEETPREIDVAGIEKKLTNHSYRFKGIEGFQAMLDLREADLAAGKVDPFIPLTNRSPSEADFEAAANRAAIYQECIDLAEGNDKIFVQELSRRIREDGPRPRRK